MDDLIERIDRTAHDFPERMAHVSGDRTLTYGELAKKSDALARYFATAFPNDNAPIAVVGHKEPEMLIAFLAAVKSGRAYVPIDVSIPRQRADLIVQRSGAIAALTSPQVAALAENERARANPTRVGLEDPFYIIFTSCTSGHPMGVVITLRFLATFLDWMQRCSRFRFQVL